VIASPVVQQAYLGMAVEDEPGLATPPPQGREPGEAERSAGREAGAA
jgi:hypothetical protein